MRKITVEIPREASITIRVCDHGGVVSDTTLTLTYEEATELREELANILDDIEEYLSE